MGVVYHANYLVWFEVGRGELMRSWGMPYAYFEQQGIFVPVVEANARYQQPAHYDDLLRIETEVAEVSPAKIKFAYKIVRAADGQVLCHGWTLHGFMSRETGRPIALPRFAPELWKALQERIADSQA